MTVRTRLTALLLVLGAAVGLTLSVGLPADAAQPYTTTPTISVSASDPCPTSRLTIHGTAFRPGLVTVRIRKMAGSTDIETRVVRVGADGTFTIVEVLPAGALGRVSVTATGAAGATADTVITIGAACPTTSPTSLTTGSTAGAGAGSGSGGGGLSSTGVAVFSLLLLAFALVGSGVVLLAGGRRRHATA